MELSKRMLAVASMVTTGNRVCDVACDHAYVPIYLVLNGICPSAIAMDINQGPLDGAISNIKKQGLSDQIITRVSDGVDKLHPGEADTLILAGIGGKLTIDILEKGKDTISLLSEIILQPQSEIEFVRQYITKSNFNIVQEDMVHEDGKFYQMMKLETKESNSVISTGLLKEIEDRFGVLLLLNHHPVLKEYLTIRKEKWQEMSQRVLRENKDPKVRKKMQHELELICMAYDYIGENQ